MKRFLFILPLMLLLAGAQPALAQFVLRGFDTVAGSGVLTGSDFTVRLTLGQAVAGTASNADFTAGFGPRAPAGAVSTGIEVAPVEADTGVPRQFRLDQNYPNPFNPETTIAFELAQTGHVTLAVYNALGRRVAMLMDDARPAGRYEATWDAAGLPSGIYFYQIRTGDFQAVRKMVLLK